MATLKHRLDETLVQLGHFATKSQALRAIMAGQVLLNGQPCTKAGQAISEQQHALLSVTQAARFVSRGGEKLLAALEQWQLPTHGVVALDVGASTGGFTDCLLQHGAKHVIAVDVGQGQLDWKLRTDPRVSVLEKTNARHLQASHLGGLALVDVAVCDVSFIGLDKVLPVMGSLTRPSPQSWMMALLKPQFEAQPYLTPAEAKAFDGVIRCETLRQRVVDGTLATLAEQLAGQWVCAGQWPSPVVGPKGNIEWLTLWKPVLTS
jgi:23S rRNA (cytidine1920-2'-O)/16S rRNA (cytidine1409-2'-O)-methyltransferase